MYLGYYDLPECPCRRRSPWPGPGQVPYRARVQAAMVQVLAAHLGPVQGDAARVLGGDETHHADSRRGRLPARTGHILHFKAELKHRVRAYYQAKGETFFSSEVCGEKHMSPRQVHGSIDPCWSLQREALRATLADWHSRQRAARRGELR